MAYNNKFFNFNGNPCYTPTSFSDITNPTYHNFNQPSVPDWSYPINTTHAPNHMTIIIKLIPTLHRVNGIHLPRVQLSTNLSSLSFLSIIFTIFIP